MASKGSDYSPSDTVMSQSTFSRKSQDSVGSTSGQSGDEKSEREEDFTKDNVASPLDLECTIQEERLTKIMDETIRKIKMAVCLHWMVQNGSLEKELTQQNYEDVMFIYEQYEHQLYSVSLLNMSAVEDIKAGDLSIRNRLSPEQGHLLYVLNSCPRLNLMVDDIIYQMKKDQYDTDNIEPIVEYLLMFEKFRELFVRQLKWTAAEVWQAKLHTRKLEISNAKLKVKIAELSEALIKEKEEFEKTLELRAQIIANLEHDLQMQNFEAAAKLHKNILDSERQMVLMTRAHAVADEMLKEEEENTRESYNETLRNDMKEEKTLRARRFKVETQLLSWIQKYDNDMMENQEELDDFTEKFEDEERRVGILEERLEEQDKKFIPLMAEREKEYADEMTEKMTEFQKHHAARILQTAWREVLANRKEKKKLKKALKKIREAEAKAEKAALKKYQREQRNIALQLKKEKAAAKAAVKAAKAEAKAAKAAAIAEAKAKKAEELAAAKEAEKQAKAAKAAEAAAEAAAAKEAEKQEMLKKRKK